MNEIRQLCTNSITIEKNLDDIYQLFQTCSSEQILPSLSLICQTISCISSEQFHIDIIQHPIFYLIRQWLENLFENWLNNQTLNSEEYRSIFYIQQYFKLISECLNENNKNQYNIILKTYFLNENFLHLLSRIIQQLIEIKNDENDIIEILYLTINSLIHIYTHDIFISHSIVNQYLTNCIFDCLNNSLIFEFSLKYFDENSFHLRIQFLLYTCLDYLIQSNMSNELFPTINQIFQLWSNNSQYINDENLSIIIIRLIQYLNQYSFNNCELIIHENLCLYIQKRFKQLCYKPNLIDDLTSLMMNISSISLGKKHLRQHGFLQIFFEQIEISIQFWHPFSQLLIQQDLFNTTFLKQIIHLIIQQTNHIIQTLNQPSFNSISSLSFTKQQLSINAIQWFNLLNKNFLSFDIFIHELIQSIKKHRFISIFIETIFFLEQDNDIPIKLIEIMLEFLWTLTFSFQNQILDNHSNFSIWLNEKHDEINIQFISQGILYILNPIRTNHNHKDSFKSNQFISMITTDENYHDLCVTLRDRLQIEQYYSVELIVTSKCQSINSLIELINRSSLCLFCLTKTMKSDNLAHLIYYYLNIQSLKIPLLSIRLEHDFDIEGNWLENIPIIDMTSILKEIRRYVKTTKRTNSQSTNDRKSVYSWSTNDVHQWYEATQCRFESLRPLIMRLNGPALVHLAEILASEPAAMYHSLNDELQQRTGSTVPLTEYASLCSELQRLIQMKPTTSSFNLHSKKKKSMNTHFCMLL